MPESLPSEVTRALVALVEKIGLLRRDLQHKGDLDAYAARIARIEQQILALADAVDATDAALAQSVREAWRLPARSLAFRNAEHQKTTNADSSKPPRNKADN
jgi:hypothetical protein